MPKLPPDEILKIVKDNQKKVKYDTRDWSIEMVLSKFNREIEDMKVTEINVPFYQREFIWNDAQISRLIETLLLGLPLPLVFLEEMEDGTLEIIDGSQRIRALDKFFKNEKKLSKLEILTNLNGLTFQDFPPTIQRQLNNASLRIIVCSILSNTKQILRMKYLSESIQQEQMQQKWKLKKEVIIRALLNLSMKNYL